MSTTGQVRLDATIVKIQSNAIRERTAGIEELKYLCKTSPGFRTLGDNSHHILFEALFCLLSNEKSTYVKASKSTVKTSAASRLSSYAEAFRACVEATVTRLRLGMVKALIEHVVQTLPVASDDSFCEPLAFCYLKVLAAITAYQPHVEHLSKEDWHITLDLCLNGIAASGSRTDSETSNPDDATLSNASRSRVIVSFAQGSQPQSGQAKHSSVNLSAMWQSVVNLSYASNAPVMEKYEILLNTAIDFLEQSPQSSGTREAFLTINVVLKRVSLERSSFAAHRMKTLIPIIKTWWQSKDPELKDEMLKTLVIGRPLMERLTFSSLKEGLDDILESLFDAVTDDYFHQLGRSRRHLQLEDLCLGTSRPSADVMPMQESILCLRASRSDSEHNWTLLHVMASICGLLDTMRPAFRRPEAVSMEITPRKRRKNVGKLLDILHEGCTASAPTQIYCLQLLAFTIAGNKMSEGHTDELLTRLIPVISHSNPLVSSWAMVAISCCAHCEMSNESVKPNKLWIRAWHPAFRLISSNPHSRSACSLCHLFLVKGRLLYKDVADSVAPMVESGLVNGPATVSDASIALWLTVRGFLSEQGSNRALQRCNNQMNAWVCGKWRPSSFADRSYALQISKCVSIHELSSMFYLPCAQSVGMRCSSVKFPALGAIGQLWLDQFRKRSLITYLILEKDLEARDRCSPIVHSAIRMTQGIAPESNVVPARLTEFLRLELDETTKKWQESTDTISEHVKGEMVFLVLSVYVVAEILGTSGNFDSLGTKEALREKSLTLGNAIGRYITRPSTEQYIVDELLLSLSPFLPESVDCSLQGKLHKHYNMLFSISKQLAPALVKRRQNLAYRAENANLEGDPLEFDQETQQPQDLLSTNSTELRLDLVASSCHAAARISISAYLEYLVASGSDGEAGEPIYASRQHVEYLCTLPTPELLGIRPFVAVLAASEVIFAPEDAGKLLDHFAKALLRRYDTRRCEVAMRLCLDYMNLIIPQCIDEDSSHPNEISMDLYSWFVDRAFADGISSTTVPMGIADLLISLMKVRLDHLLDRSRPSAGTTLFGMLKYGQLPVQYHVAKHLPALFRTFALDQHMAIYEDIRRSLPYDMDVIEGIALRLAVFSDLASAWQTLLLHCIYHIFETAGLVKEAEPFASICISQVAKAFGLRKPQELFRVFAPQLLYTWLSEQSLNSIPWSIFGYCNLKELVIDVEGEIVSQLVMRGSDQNLESLAILLSKTKTELVSRPFPQVAAYVFADDAMRGSSQASGTFEAENRFLEYHSRIHFSEKMEQQFPNVVAYLFCRLEIPDDFARAFERHGSYKYAGKTFEKIVGDTPLPANISSCQHPSWRYKHLVDAIEKLCKRTHQAASNIWTPYLVTLTARMLIDDIVPELGSLYARIQIQRLRILVCLSGSTVFQGYVLEMLLHALRPYITDNHCAQDTIGLFRYLVETGKDHLSQRPSFLCGTSLAIFLSLHRFLHAPQKSNTQERHDRTTLSKAQSFHQWLSQYLAQYTSDKTFIKAFPNFRVIIDSSRLVTTRGGSTKKSSEGELLEALLKDVTGPKRLISAPLFDICFGLLCQDFTVPESLHDDIFATDETAFSYAAAIWHTSASKQVNETYMAWSARVLGRSFAWNGQVPSNIGKETNYANIRDVSISEEFAGVTLGGKKSRKYGEEEDALVPSLIALVRSLTGLLQSESPGDVSVAEHAIRRILSLSSNSEEGSLVESGLDSNVRKALQPSATMRLIEPSPSRESSQTFNLKNSFMQIDVEPAEQWIRHLTISLINHRRSDPIAGSLERAVLETGNLSENIFPFLLHITLLRDQKSRLEARAEISAGFKWCFSRADKSNVWQIRRLLHAVLYLRSRPIPKEDTAFQRNFWLDIDFNEAAAAAVTCRMFKTGLLLIEVGQSIRGDSSRGQSSLPDKLPTVLMLAIFREVEDPDSYHGVPKQPTLQSIAEDHAFEGSGSQELLVRGAQSDAMLRSGKSSELGFLSGAVNSVARLNLNSLTNCLSSNEKASVLDDSLTESMTHSALKLSQWDITVPSAFASDTSTVYKTFQSISSVSDAKSAKDVLDVGAINVLNRARSSECTGQALRSAFAALAAIMEAYEVLSSHDVLDLEQATKAMYARTHWMKTSRSKEVSRILTSRQNILGLVSNSESLQRLLSVDAKAIRHLEVQANLDASVTYRAVGSYQESMANVAYLSYLIEPSKKLDLWIEDAVKNETANTLWDREEFIPAINILKELAAADSIQSQSIPVGKADLLATMGHHISHARLERPDEILSKYLSRAQAELGGKSEGHEAGHVFHELASYCHGQLTNPDNVEEFCRSEKFKEKRLAEIRELDDFLSGRISDEHRSRAKSERSKAKKWLEIDRVENDRLNRGREQFLRQSLENYLLSLTACDQYDSDVLRFFALWLEHATYVQANEAVARALSRVPSHKFAGLMNQLASRLQDSDDKFQRLIFLLVERICVDHPFHGMYHIFAGIKTGGIGDKNGMSRFAATHKIADKLKSNSGVFKTWTAVCYANEIYIKLAQSKTNLSSGQKGLLQNFPASRSVSRDIPQLKVPPITMSVGLRQDRNYDKTPRIVRFRSEMLVASGISAPKIVTAVTSDGSMFKQLFKSGGEDLRQDAIMEQVFEQVGDLLQLNKASKQRNLRIRTYKVTPLTSTSGAIEFVANTMPLNDFLRHAHVEYHPRDRSWDHCRKVIDSNRSQSQKERLRAYKDLVNHFHPVLRHFFFEKFHDPDDWFNKRLAYTRSTAAISILGHVLGLGDRHCQNILLDTSTGEVVHIDLGVAFEAGRILQVPEVVPFRLTRDIVDGFGIMRTEGVFRRCCEFTLDALRKNRDAIMTLLNVLRYDPLYSWSMSPLRAKRLREEQGRESHAGSTPSSNSKSARRSRGGDNGFSFDERQKTNDKGSVEDTGEADRALSVVERKLAPGLSVMAAVNELIQQATDERNLAVLFGGWAAFA